MNPAVKEMRKIVQSGLLGRLYSIESRVVATSVAVRGLGHYLFQKDRSGGGILHWLGCQHLDPMRFVSGQEIDVEDLAVASFQFSGGALGGIHAGYLLPEPTSDPYRSSTYETYLGLHGEYGYIRWDPVVNHLTAISTHPDWAGASHRTFDFIADSRPGYGSDGYELVRAFAAAGEGVGEGRRGADKFADSEDAWKVLQIVEACYASSESGEGEISAGRP